MGKLNQWQIRCAHKTTGRETKKEDITWTRPDGTYSTGRYSVWTVYVAALAGWCGHGNELSAYDNAGNVRTNAQTRTFKDLNVKWLSYLINHHIMKMYGEMEA